MLPTHNKCEAFEDLLDGALFLEMSGDEKEGDRPGDDIGGNVLRELKFCFPILMGEIFACLIRITRDPFDIFDKSVNSVGGPYLFENFFFL